MSQSLARAFQVPAETWLEIIQFLDRFSLDKVQFSCRRWAQFMPNRQAQLALRELTAVEFSSYLHLVAFGGSGIRLYSASVSSRENVYRIAFPESDCSNPVEGFFSLLSHSVLTGDVVINGIGVDEICTPEVEAHLRSAVVLGTLFFSTHDLNRVPTALPLLASYFARVAAVGTWNYSKEVLRECLAAGYQFTVELLTWPILIDLLFPRLLALPNDRRLHARSARLPYYVLHYIAERHQDSTETTSGELIIDSVVNESNWTMVGSVLDNGVGMQMCFSKDGGSLRIARQKAGTF